MKIEFEPLTNLDLAQFGCSILKLHPCSLKAVLKYEGGEKEDVIVGYIAIEDSPFNLISTENDSEEIKDYKNKFNNIPSFLLRKIYFTEEYRYRGDLENLFYKVVSELPFKSIVWYRPSIMGNGVGLIEQIGGFNPIPYNIEPNVLIFSLQC